MKRVTKFFAGAAAALAMAGGVAMAATSAWQGEAPLRNAGWQVMSVDATALIMFEGDGVERHGSEARMWVALLFSKPQDNGGKSYSMLLARNSFDCNAKTWRPVTVATFDAAGNPVESKETSSAAAQKVDGVQAEMLDKACNPKTVADDDKMTDVLIAHAAYLQLIEQGKIK